MGIPSEIQNLLKFLDNGMVWVYIGIFFIVMYLLISLLTWSFIKPLKYLGIPTMISGMLLIVIRLLARTIINLFDLKINFINNLLPVILKPLLIYGIICTIIGILMIITYKIINKKKKEV